jgi:hypothetical protein
MKIYIQHYEHKHYTINECILLTATGLGYPVPHWQGYSLIREKTTGPSIPSPWTYTADFSDNEGFQLGRSSESPPSIRGKTLATIPILDHPWMVRVRTASADEQRRRRYICNALIWYLKIYVVTLKVIFQYFFNEVWIVLKVSYVFIFPQGGIEGWTGRRERHHPSTSF